MSKSNGLHAFRPAAMRAVIFVHRETSGSGSLLKIGACCSHMAVILARSAAFLLQSILPVLQLDRGGEDTVMSHSPPLLLCLFQHFLEGRSCTVLASQSCIQTAHLCSLCSTPAMPRSGCTRLVSSLAGRHRSGTKTTTGRMKPGISLCAGALAVPEGEAAAGNG